MRMWMIDPALLCPKHLLGEHNELHMLAGSVLRGKSLEGFIRNGLLEPAALYARHEALAAEMLTRGYRHQSPLPPQKDVLAALAAYPEHVRTACVDRQASVKALQERCNSCVLRMLNQNPA